MLLRNDEPNQLDAHGEEAAAAWYRCASAMASSGVVTSPVGPVVAGVRRRSGSTRARASWISPTTGAEVPGLGEREVGTLRMRAVVPGHAGHGFELVS
jgi:hypothetical protein